MLAACTSDDEPSPGSATTVSVWVSGDPEETQAFVDVAEAFEASQDAIDIDLVVIAERDDLIARLSTSLAGGEPPDLFLMNYRYLGQFEAKGAIEPVGPYLDGSSALSAERLLSRGDVGVPERRRADVHAAERLEPRDLLQRGPVRGGRRRAARRRAGRGPT